MMPSNGTFMSSIIIIKRVHFTILNGKLGALKKKSKWKRGLLIRKQFSKKFERFLRILGFLAVFPRLSSDLDWSLFIKWFLVENIVYCGVRF